MLVYRFFSLEIWVTLTQIVLAITIERLVSIQAMTCTLLQRKKLKFQRIQ